MKKSSSSKELLIDWLRTALDYELYSGLRWSDREKEIFYVKWIHKSSEQWSDEDLEPFRAWAGHKGKLDGKNPKQLKATFRCALNSKKELDEHSRGKDRRYWQFVDPNTAKKDNTPKKKRGNNKGGKSRGVDCTVAAAYNNDIKSTNNNGLFSPKISSNSEGKVPRSNKFPAYDSFSNFQPLTPPDQANENPYTRTDFKFSKDDMDTLGKCGSNYRHADPVHANISAISTNNNLVGNTHETSFVLPPFETFGSFRSLTPPPQKNEVYFVPTVTEHSTNYTPPPDQSRLVPPQKASHISRDSYDQSSTDIWQPNCWPVPEKEPKGLSDFFSSDFIGIYKSSSKEPENNNMDFLDMDQYVPVMNTNNIVQIHNKNVQPNLINRTPSTNQTQTDQLLEDYFLSEVDPDACQRLMQEIEISSSMPQYRLQS